MMALKCIQECVLKAVSQYYVALGYRPSGININDLFMNAIVTTSFLSSLPQDLVDAFYRIFIVLWAS
jgi:hypothetical protein